MLSPQSTKSKTPTISSGEIFELGENLSRLKIFKEQSQYLADFFKRYIEGQAFLWVKSPPKSMQINIPAVNFPFNVEYLSSAENDCQIKTSEIDHRYWYQCPLHFGEDTFAQLLIERQRPLEEQSIHTLKELTTVASPAIYATLQSHHKEWRQQQLALVRSVSAKISQITDLDELTHQVTQLTQETFNFYYVAVFLIDEQRNRLHFKASASVDGSDSPEFENPSHPGFAMGEHMIGHVAKTGNELISNDVSQEPRYRQVDSLKDTKSEVVIPLKVENRIFGVFDVQSDQINGFKDDDLLVLRSLADNIAIAVESIYLYQNVQKRADQLSIVSEVSRAITVILDTDKLLEQIVKLIHDDFGFPFVHLYIVDLVQQKVAFKAGSGERTQAYAKAGVSYNLDADSGIITEAIQQGKTLRINNVQSDPRYIESPFAEQASGSEMAIPLIFGSDILGVLDIQSQSINAFTLEDQQLMETLADNIAIAIRNAKLFRSERWRRQVTESLRDIAGLISENTRLETVLDEILSQLLERLPCDFAGFWLYDPDSSLDAPINNRELHLMAFQTSQDYVDFDPQHMTSFPDEWVQIAITTKQPAIRKPEDALGPVASLLNLPKDYAAIAAPLHIGNTVLGVLTLLHHTPRRYGEESKMITSTFASYGAIAINNNQLYNTSQEQAWIATILLQVANATQSLTNLDELLQTIVRLTPMMIGVKGCAIFLKDPETPVFTLQAVYNIGEFFENAEKPLLFRNAPILNDLINTHEPIRANNLEADFNLPENTNQELIQDDLVILPILSRNELLGAFLLAYDPENNQKMDQSRAISSERYKIIQGIIQQTAIGIENIRLLEAKQEEAYISTVLLQAAQAVVNNVELGDTLDALIHLMPILVGIESSVIYLWDKEAKIFLTAHASLKSTADEKELIGTTYELGDLPILDLILGQNRPYVHPFIDNILPPEDWDLLVPDEGQIDPMPILQSMYPLLIGFPLSAKDEMFGILLAQDNNISTNRERRFELLWGISQQASLAIQNDIINKEISERQRLEREFHLARQIQQTFLPNEVPETPGWQLDVKWETARQVGGDFYDYFFLPDGRLAFVIADVSDKGLAASLYMTVTRTLIRATAMENLPPDETLEHVNDLLLVNSQNGLFITTFYGILSIEDGKLQYTIAGHNPPLLISQNTHEVVEFKRGGTALGALPNISLSQNEIILTPGDCLVLYTDGVTEAFNAQNQMYGQDRFMNLLHTLIGESATKVIEAVETDLESFRQGAALSDDTTLLAIYRQPLQANEHGDGGSSQNAVNGAAKQSF